MSTRIHRAMGWGMPWDAFEEATILDCEAQDTSDRLDQIFSAATDADLTVPEDVRKHSWNTRGVNVIVDPRLLALDMEFTDEVVDGKRVRVEPELAKASDLYHQAINADRTLAVIFLPNATYAESWVRFDDDLDYAYEQYRNGDNEGEPREIVQTMKFNPYPFSNFLMDKDGNPLEWEAYFLLDETYPDGWFPAVPSEIRWYLKQLGIMDDAGINKLRPMLVQTWG